MALLPINKIEKVAEKRIQIQQLDVYKNSISGDAVHGGTITGFQSDGIKDQADFTRIVVKNDVIEVETDLHIKGTVKVENLEYVQAQVPKLNVMEALMIDHNEVVWKNALGKSVKKSNLEELYEEMLKENDENDVQMKRLKAQIEEAKLPEQSLESTYITKKVKR